MSFAIGSIKAHIRRKSFLETNRSFSDVHVQLFNYYILTGKLEARVHSFDKKWFGTAAEVGQPRIDLGSLIR